MREMAPYVSRVYLNEGASRVSLKGGTRAFPVLTTVKLLTFIKNLVLRFFKNPYSSFYNCCIVLCTISGFSNVKAV